MSDFLYRDSLEKLDPSVKELIDLENERQTRKLILIPSESLSPLAVRESLGSVFKISTQKVTQMKKPDG